jgi:hypothetical protein
MIFNNPDPCNIIFNYPDPCNIIFNFLTIRDLCRLERANKQTKKLVEKSVFWSTICQKTGQATKQLLVNNLKQCDLSTKQYWKEIINEGRVLCDRSLRQKLDVILAHLIFQWRINGQIPWAMDQLKAIRSCPDGDEVTKYNATGVLFLRQVSHLTKETVSETEDLLLGYNLESFKKTTLVPFDLMRLGVEELRYNTALLDSNNPDLLTKILDARPSTLSHIFCNIDTLNDHCKPQAMRLYIRVLQNGKEAPDDPLYDRLLCQYAKELDEKFSDSYYHVSNSFWIKLLRFFQPKEYLYKKLEEIAAKDLFGRKNLALAQLAYYRDGDKKKTLEFLNAVLSDPSESVANWQEAKLLKYYFGLGK